MVITIPDLTGAECGDIAITAAEGGIGYWSVIDSYRPSRWWGDDLDPNREVADDFVFYTLEWEGRHPAEEKIDVTPALIKRGFEKLVNDGYFLGLLTQAREDWTGEIDSNDADNIIQMGAFGELVFA